MDNEPYRDIGHHEAADMIVADARCAGLTAYREFKLPSGKVADVFIRSPEDCVTIIEVKSEFRASHFTSAFEKYWSWCNRLWLAVPELSMQGAGLELNAARGFRDSHRVGLLGIYRQGNAVLRQPQDHVIPRDNRERLTQHVLQWLTTGGAGSL